jgi:hypothetical protein
VSPTSPHHCVQASLLIRPTRYFRISYVFGFLLTSVIGAVVVTELVALLLGRHPPISVSAAVLVPIIAVILVVRLTTDPRVRRIRGELDVCGVTVPRVGRRALIDWEHVETVVLRTGSRFPYVEYVDFVLVPDTTSARTVGPWASIQVSGSNSTLDSVATHVQILRPDLAHDRSRS